VAVVRTEAEINHEGANVTLRMDFREGGFELQLTEVQPSCVAL